MTDRNLLIRVRLRDRRAFRAVLVLLWLGFLAGCAAPGPAVREVSHRTITRTISKGNEEYYVHDRASRIKIEPRDLPADQQREEFLVRWTPATVALVKFEYRQIKRPVVIGAREFRSTGKQSTTFAITGEDFTTGGAVAAWRVSLWDDQQHLLAERRSALW